MGPLQAAGSSAAGFWDGGARHLRSGDLPGYDVRGVVRTCLIGEKDKMSNVRALESAYVVST